MTSLSETMHVEFVKKEELFDNDNGLSLHRLLSLASSAKLSSERKTLFSPIVFRKSEKRLRPNILIPKGRIKSDNTKQIISITFAALLNIQHRFYIRMVIRLSP